MSQSFEREVISIPAAGTTNIIYKYKVHAHPDKPKGYNYKKALYYTFRKSGGVMEKLFTLDFVVSLDPYNPSRIDEHIKSSDKRERVLDYIKERMSSYGFDHLDTNYKFYIFSEEIKLPNHPRRPGQRNQSYFTLKEMFSGKDIIENCNKKIRIVHNTNNNTGELDEAEDYVEGAVQKRLVNKYERNSAARQKCLNYYGYSCYVCGFESKYKYGEFAKNIIHVHHINQLAEIDHEYKVNPITDLRPVCPNCHAVIHSRTPAYEVDELKELLRIKSIV